MSMARRLYINGISLISLSIMLGAAQSLLVAIIRRMGIGQRNITLIRILPSARHCCSLACPFGLSITGWGREPCGNNPDEAGSLFRAIYIYSALLITSISLPPLKRS